MIYIYMHIIYYIFCCSVNLSIVEWFEVTFIMGAT